MNIFFRSIAAGILTLSAAAAAGQAYPTKPIRIITPDSAGGVVDILTRAVAMRLGERLKQPVIIENRPGADGMIGMDACARASGDGYTFCSVSIAWMSVVPNMRKVPFDPLKDVVPITPMVRSSGLIYVHPNVPASNLKELVALAKSKPGALTYASFGNGSIAHLVMESLKQQTDTDMLHIPHQGGPRAINAVMAGEVQVGYFALGPVVQLVKSGRVKPIAAYRTTRSALLPDVPTIAEQGYEPILKTWFGIVAPKGIPGAIAQTITAELTRIVNDAEFREKAIEPQGFEPFTLPSSEFATMLQEERQQMIKLIKDRNIKPD